jgi:hypothetical protein
MSSRSRLPIRSRSRRALFNAAVDGLEQRLLAHAGDHVVLPAGLSVADINAMPIDSPLRYDLHVEEAGHSADGDALIPAPVTTILNSGPSSNRVDIVLLGDGYTAAQLSTYSSHASTFLSTFFNETPYDRYKSYFNVHRVDVTSTDSGVDNDFTNGISRNTALGMNFFCSGIERLLCIDTSAARNYALNAPQADEIIGIANSTKYGGAGYPSAEISTYAGGNTSSIEVAKHEFAHAIGDLADEYDYADGTVHSAAEPSLQNVSVYNATDMAARQAKWYRWLDLPNVDTFEGGDLAQYGIYRPTVNSKMRSLNRPFEEVNVEQLILKIYASVRPIDSATAAGTYQTQTSTFSVDPVDPASGPALAVQWYIDDVAVPGATGLNFAPSEFGVEGNHTLKVVVQDTTTAVRDEAKRATLMTDSRSWTLQDTLPPSVTYAPLGYNELPRMSLKATFNESVGASLEASDLVLFNQTTGQIFPAASIAVSYDVPTRVATFTFPGVANGALPDGNYIASFGGGRVTDVAGNAVPSSLSTSFFVKAGDANRDRTVDFADLVILAQNYGQTGRTFSQGNFNYSADGLVDFSDLVILAQQYNTSVAALNSVSMSAAAVGTQKAATKKREPAAATAGLV